MKLLLLDITFVFSCFGFSQVSDFNYINFSKANNRAKLLKGESLNNLPLLSYKLTEGLETDVEKFRAIYLWVCQNISVDLVQANNVINMRKKYSNDSIAFYHLNSSQLRKTFNRLIKKRKTMCTGYAFLIRELSYFANIECEIINGYGRTATSNIGSLNLPNHSWNSVKLNNKWFLCDAIWASGYEKNGHFVRDYNNGYFLSDPILFSKNHYPLEKKWLLQNKLINSKFEATPIVYGGAFKHNITPIYPEKLITEVKKNQNIKFKLKTQESIHISKIKLIQFLPNYELNIPVYNLKKVNDLIYFSSKLKSGGSYDIHLKIENDIIATYTFKVSK